MSSRITLPGIHRGDDRSREPFPGAPTWARRRMATGLYERLPLQRVTDHVSDDDAGNLTQVLQVWVVPASATSPGDDIEFGPTPLGVRVRVETTPDQYAITAGYTPAPYPRIRS